MNQRRFLHLHRAAHRLTAPPPSRAAAAAAARGCDTPRTHVGPTLCPAPTACRSGKKRLSSGGYIAEDNSGRGNIFAVEPRQLYTSSPTSDRAARQGLGGIQGLGVLAAALGVVALATLALANNSGESSLQAMAAGGEALDGLGAIAGRVAATL